MHPQRSIDYPEYLKPCVLIDEILAELKKRYPDEFVPNIETQIELTAGFGTSKITKRTFRRDRNYRR